MAELNEWLGIPYAAQPVGNLRWAPPQSHAPWGLTLAATAFGSSCTQPAVGKSGPNTGSENCLFVNVWAPSGARGLPVMAHIHGGGFFKGSGNDDNTLLVNAGNEVIVSMNYRLNIFGFLAHSARTLRQALRTGHVNRVPVIAGVDRDENLVGFPVTAADYTAIVQAQYGTIAARVLALYPVVRFNSPFVAWRTVAADSDTVCSALRIAEKLSKWMPVFAYEIDFGDVGTALTGESMGASHVGSWNLTPVAGLDANRQVLQNQELAYVTTLARTGDPESTERVTIRRASCDRARSSLREYLNALTSADLSHINGR